MFQKKKKNDRIAEILSTMSLESDAEEASTVEETDLLRRSVKKQKRDDHNLDEDMGMETGWAGHSFAAAVKGRTSKQSIYTGEDKDDSMDDMVMADIVEECEAVLASPTCPTVDMPWDEYKSRWKPWRRALIIRVLGKHFNYKILEPRIKRLWNLDNGCELIDLDKRYMIARFYSREDYTSVLNGGPWMVMGHYLTITKWRPNFVPFDQHVSTTLVWIRFPKLPMEMFNTAVLTRLGNVLGRTIKVDTTSKDAIRGKFARVCVEMNLNWPLVSTVTVYETVHAVEYEGLYNICFKCGRLGHRMEQCIGGQSERTENYTHAQSSKPMVSSTEQPYDPWLLSVHVRKRMQQMQSKWSGQSNQPENRNPGSMRCAQDYQTGRTRYDEEWTTVQIDPKTKDSHSNRDKQPGESQSTGSVGMSASGKSHFSVLDDLQSEEDVLAGIGSSKSGIFLKRVGLGGKLIRRRQNLLRNI